jgi:hypothetical protein
MCPLASLPLAIRLGLLARSHWALKTNMEILSYLFVALPFVIAFLVALSLCALAFMFVNGATMAMGVMVGIFLLETSSLTPLALNLGLWVYPPDLLALLLLPAFVYRLAWLKKFNAIPLVWWVLGIVWMGSFGWGLAQYGTGAGVDFRPFFYVWLGTAYLATFDYDEAFARRFMKFFIIMGVGVCAIAYYRWTMAGFDYEFHRELERFDATGVALLRVIPAGATFILTCALFVVAYQAVTESFRPTAWLLAGVFAITVIAMQHRSVWVAGCAGFVALALALRQLRAGAGSKLFSMALAGMVLIVLIAVSGRFQGAVQSIEDQASRATSTSSGTFVGRVIGWQALLKMWVDSRSPVTYLVGKPFGSGYDRYESSNSGTEKVGYMPHNFYVQLLYRGGLIGLIAFVWATAQGVRTLWDRLRRKDDAMAPLLFAMLVAQLVYYVPYGIDYGQMISFGLLLGMIAKEHTKVKPTTIVVPDTRARPKPLARGMSDVR